MAAATKSKTSGRKPKAKAKAKATAAPAPLLERHRLSALFGDADSATLDGMADSVKERGFDTPKGLVFQGMILDGWNRESIRRRLGLPTEALEWIEFAGTEAEAKDLVMAENLWRRHITRPARAVLAVESGEASRLTKEAAARVKAGAAKGGKKAKGTGGKRKKADTVARVLSKAFKITEDMAKWAIKGAALWDAGKVATAQEGYDVARKGAKPKTARVRPTSAAVKKANAEHAKDMAHLEGRVTKERAEAAKVTAKAVTQAVAKVEKKAVKAVSALDAAKAEIKTLKAKVASLTKALAAAKRKR